MPTQAVTLRRWQVVAAFLLLVASSVAVSVWNDRRIDQAEHRIQSNAASVEQLEEQAAELEAANQRQNEFRADLVRARERADLVICREIEKVKERIRATVTVDRAEFRDTLTQLNIDPDSEQGQALFARAKANEEETLERFRARNCKVLTSRP